MAGYSIQETTYNIKACRNRGIRKCRDTGLKDAKDTGRRNKDAKDPGRRIKLNPSQPGFLDIPFKQFHIISVNFASLLSYFCVILGSWGVLGCQKGPSSEKPRFSQGYFQKHLRDIGGERITPKS